MKDYITANERMKGLKVNKKKKWKWLNPKHGMRNNNKQESNSHLFINETQCKKNSDLEKGNES